MSQLDPNPFWDQHRNRLIPNSIFTPAGNEEKGALSNILFAIQSISYSTGQMGKNSYLSHPRSVSLLLSSVRTPLETGWDLILTGACKGTQPQPYFAFKSDPLEVASYWTTRCEPVLVGIVASAEV
uniref:Uncharacterized protein n=1 Tax=Ananas comosus var. bracteatus TaxID=296719 RepID=A0A6V7PYI6_ANACO|nr:unnamed protein product [Ananas comosus var. bracteatus]